MSVRQREILAIARVEGRVQVDVLAARFSVTQQTIRRDLTEMAEAGHLDRVHGGAVLAAGLRNDGYDQRRRQNEAAKAAIAGACAAAIPHNSSVLISVGTTTEAVARALRFHSGLTVVTNSMNAARALASNPGCEVVLAGGTLRRSDGGLVGDLAAHVFGQFKADFGIFGCSAIDGDGGVLDRDPEAVQAARAIVAQSRQTLLVADRTKLHQTASGWIAALEQITTLFTDAPLPGPLALRCQGWGTRVAVV